MLLSENIYLKIKCILLIKTEFFYSKKKQKMCLKQLDAYELRCSNLRKKKDKIFSLDKKKAPEICPQINQILSLFHI